MGKFMESLLRTGKFAGIFQNQLNGVDCGFFVCAFAYEHVNDRDKKKAHFQGGLVRGSDW